MLFKQIILINKYLLSYPTYKSLATGCTLTNVNRNSLFIMAAYLTM